MRTDITPEEAARWADKGLVERYPKLALGMKKQEITREEVTAKKIKIAEAYEKMLNVISYYQDIPEDDKKMYAIWLIGTYFHESFPAYPYLILNAMRGSGKTRLMRLGSYLANGGDGLINTNVTEAVIFRHPRNKIFCIDEAENTNTKEKQALRQLLNSAYKKGTKISRMKKQKTKEEEKFVTEQYEPYFPIMLASIKQVEEVLSDRAITLTISKSFLERVVKKIEDFDNDEGIKSIKANLSDIGDVTLWQENIYKEWNKWIENKYNNVTNDIYQYNVNNVTNVTNIELEELFIKIDNSKILGRNLELLMPLFFVAKLIDDKLLDDFINISSKVVQEKKEEEFANSKDVAVYSFVSGLDDKTEYVVKNLLGHFRMFIGDDDGDDMWLNERWFGQALKRLGLIKERRRANNARYVKLNIDFAIKQNNNFKANVRSEE